MKYLILIAAKFIFGSISFSRGWVSSIFGIFLVFWGLSDVLNVLNVGGKDIVNSLPSPIEQESANTVVSVIDSTKKFYDGLDNAIFSTIETIASEALPNDNNE